MASDYLNSLSYLPAAKNPRDLTVENIVQLYIDERRNILSPATIDKYQRSLNTTLGADFKALRVKRITEADIINEVNRLAAKYAPKTVKNTIFFVIPIIRKYRRDLVLDDIRLPKVYKQQKIYPSPQEIIEAFKDDRMELEVLLGLCYGLRKEEIRGLKFTDIKDDKMYIRRVKIDIQKETVVRENAAKTVNSIRTISLSQYVLSLIAARDGEYICPYTGHAIYMHFKRKMKALGYDISFHDLRHINASVMLFLGVPDKYAMERGGWATDSTLKNVYQSTFSDQRTRFDRVIDGYFENIYTK